MSLDLTPFDVCKRLIGPPERIAEICDLGEKSSYYWANPSKNRAAGDISSTINQRKLLAHSDAHQLGLTAEHLVRGASEAEIAAILQARADAPDRRPDPELLPDFVSSRVAAE